MLGGVEIHVDRVARELTRRGHEVVVQCTTESDDDDRYPYEVLRVPNDSWRFSPRVEKDIIWHHDFFTYGDGHRQWSKSGKSFITFHGYEGVCPPALVALAERQRVNDDCDGSIGVGLYIEKWYGTKCDSLIWGGVGADDIVPMDQMEPQRFIWVGGLRDDMDLWAYIQFLERLRINGWEPKLDVVGGGQLKVEEALAEMATMRGLDVAFHGWMENYDELYERASYVLSGGYLSMMRAMANFKTTVSLWGNELKRDYVEWFPGRLVSGSVSELDDVARRMREGLPPEVLDGNRQWALSQSWSAVADAYEELWEKALAKG